MQPGWPADRIEAVIEPFRRFRDLIWTIPATSGSTADVVAAARHPRCRGAVHRAVLVVIGNMAMTDADQHDRGGDYLTRLNPRKGRSKVGYEREAMGPLSRHLDRANRTRGRLG